jgi:hypothetical protein
VAVRLVRAGGRVVLVSFRLAGDWPPRPAALVLARVERTYRRLHSLVIHERLATSPTLVLRSVYRAAAPSSLEITSSNGNRAILIGGRRWDRHPGAGWEESEQVPALTSVTPFWRGALQDVTLLGTPTVAGRPALRVSFAAPQMAAFFDLVVDRATYRPLRLEMTAAAHFMQHRYSGFDTALRIEPPQTAARATP